MKKLILLASVFLMLHSTAVLAQKGKDSEQGPGKLLTYKTRVGKDAKIVITMFNGDVKVVGHNDDEVVIETSNYTPPPTRAAGLKPLINQAEDNSGLGLAVEKEDNTLKITKISRRNGDHTIKVPQNASIVFEEGDWYGNNFSLNNVHGEIELKLNKANANLVNVSGPVIANTTAGNINIKFTSLN